MGKMPTADYKFARSAAGATDAATCTVLPNRGRLIALESTFFNGICKYPCITGGLASQGSDGKEFANEKTPLKKSSNNRATKILLG